MSSSFLLANYRPFTKKETNSTGLEIKKKTIFRPDQTPRSSETEIPTSSGLGMKFDKKFGPMKLLCCSIEPFANGSRVLNQES